MRKMLAMMSAAVNLTAVAFLAVPEVSHAVLLSVPDTISGSVAMDEGATLNRSFDISDLVSLYGSNIRSASLYFSFKDDNDALVSAGSTASSTRSGGDIIVKHINLYTNPAETVEISLLNGQQTATVSTPEYNSSRLTRRATSDLGYWATGYHYYTWYDGWDIFHWFPHTGSESYSYFVRTGTQYDNYYDVVSGHKGSVDCTLTLNSDGILALGQTGVLDYSLTMLTGDINFLKGRLDLDIDESNNMAPVPEPGSLLLCCIGLAGGAGFLKLNKKS